MLYLSLCFQLEGYSHIQETTDFIGNVIDEQRCRIVSPRFKLNSKSYTSHF